MSKCQHGKFVVMECICDAYLLSIVITMLCTRDGYCMHDVAYAFASFFENDHGRFYNYSKW